MNLDPRDVADKSSTARAREPAGEPRANAPAWWPGREIAVTLTVTTVVCAGFVLWLDIPIARAFERWSAQPITDVFRVITRAGHSALWYTPTGLLLIFALWCSRTVGETAIVWRHRARSLVYVIVSMAISGTLVNALKIAFGRYRPRFLFSEDLYGFAPFMVEIKHAGFPSGHTQSIVAAMVSFGFLFPRWRWALWAFAALVAASRFTTAVHFASDVIAGAVIAVLIAWTLKRYVERDGLAVTWATART
jgi:membrane-associated phospholipid phosphatase